MLICIEDYGKTSKYHFCHKNYFTTFIVTNEILMRNDDLYSYSNLQLLSQIIKSLLDPIREDSHDDQKYLHSRLSF